MDFKAFVSTIIDKIFNPLTVLIVAAALVYFLLGVLKYVRSAGNDEERREGGMMMTYGIIALFVMVSVWGLVRVVSNTFSGLENGPITPPQLKGSPR